MVEAFTTVLHVTGTSVGVSQKPSFTILRTGEFVVSEINCSHSINSYDRIYWYKQDESRALKLLGYLYTNIQNMEEDVKGKISFDGDGRSGSSLSIAAVGLKDSGVYFCAASLHSAAGSPQDNTQTPAVSPRRELFNLPRPLFTTSLSSIFTPIKILRSCKCAQLARKRLRHTKSPRTTGDKVHANRKQLETCGTVATGGLGDGSRSQEPGDILTGPAGLTR
uniref:Ig-like domain-containing protein n=1 Tax=Takifugu rubripes TaxID=31033 RepID=A0A3B5KGJ4_TAKRU